MNIELAEKVLRQITEHPETHDQKHWGFRTACGTSYCIAGWTCALSGDTLNWTIEPLHMFLQVDSVTPLGGHAPQMIRHRAMDLLGLGSKQAENLFYELDEAEAIVRLRELIEEAKMEEEGL